MLFYVAGAKAALIWIITVSYHSSKCQILGLMLEDVEMMSVTQEEDHFIAACNPRFTAHIPAGPVPSTTAQHKAQSRAPTHRCSFATPLTHTHVVTR